MKQYITVYDSFKIKSAILQLASRVMKIIEERGAENCIYLTVLEGGSYISHKILDRLPQDMLNDLTVSSIKVSSYRGDRRGELKYEYIPNTDCTGKTVIIVDDFCDSGSTTNNLFHLYKDQIRAGEVIFVTLLARKHRKLDQDVTLLYGIEDDTDNFYFGCGMDENGRGRYMNRISTIRNEKGKE